MHSAPPLPRHAEILPRAVHRFVLSPLTAGGEQVGLSFLEDWPHPEILPIDVRRKMASQFAHRTKRRTTEILSCPVNVAIPEDLTWCNHHEATALRRCAARVGTREVHQVPIGTLKTIARMGLGHLLTVLAQCEARTEGARTELLAAGRLAAAALHGAPWLTGVKQGDARFDLAAHESAADLLAATQDEACPSSRELRAVLAMHRASKMSVREEMEDLAAALHPSLPGRRGVPISAATAAFVHFHLGDTQSRAIRSRQAALASGMSTNRATRVVEQMLAAAQGMRPALPAVSAALEMYTSAPDPRADAQFSQMGEGMSAAGLHTLLRGLDRCICAQRIESIQSGVHAARQALRRAIPRVLQQCWLDTVGPSDPRFPLLGFASAHDLVMHTATASEPPVTHISAVLRLDHARRMSAEEEILDVLRSMGTPTHSCEIYLQFLASPGRSVRARAETAAVQCGQTPGSVLAMVMRLNRRIRNSRPAMPVTSEGLLMLRPVALTEAGPTGLIGSTRAFGRRLSVDGLRAFGVLTGIARGWDEQTLGSQPLPSGLKARRAA